MYLDEVISILEADNRRIYSRKEKELVPIINTRAYNKHNEIVSKENDLGLRYFIEKAKKNFKAIDGKLEGKDIRLIKTELKKPNTTDDDSLLDNIVNKTIKRKMGLNAEPKYLQTSERREDGALYNLNPVNRKNVVSMNGLDTLPKMQRQKIDKNGNPMVDKKGKEVFEDIPNLINFNALSRKQKTIIKNNMTTEFIKVINSETNKGKIPQAIDVKWLSNTQKKLLVSDAGVSNVKLPNNFYANFNPGSITTNIPSGIGIDGILKRGKEVYFIERKITEYRSDTGRTLVKIIKDVNDVAKKTSKFIITPVINYRSSSSDKDIARKQEEEMKHYVNDNAGRLRRQFHKPDSLNELLKKDSSIINLGHLNSKYQKDKAIINEIKLLLKGLVR